MTRKECLEQAMGCVLRDRNNSYGGPEDNFGRIALFWSDYLGVKLDGVDVAMMMALLKIARVRNNKSYEDGYIDLAGYAACGAELAGAMQAREDAVREAGEGYRKLKAKAEGCEELVQGDVAEECKGCFKSLEKDDVFDAPQTPQELYQHIVDCNPSVYPRKPTGEELAEMAEEETNV